MKKLAPLFLALSVALGGLLVSPAQAAYPAYPGTVVTSCHVKLLKHGKKAKFSVTTDGNGTPTGRVKVVAKRHHKKVKHVYAYGGGVTKRHFKRLASGRWKVRMVYTPPTGSVYKGCVRVRYQSFG
jgi:hypothetical protein